MIFGNNKKNQDYKDRDMQVSFGSLGYSNKVKFLGIIIDQYLTFEEHAAKKITEYDPTVL